MLKRIALRLFLLAVRAIGNAAAHTKDYVNIARGRHKLVYAETFGRLPHMENAKHVAIIAVYPNKYLLPFITNLMNGFKQNGFFVLAVASKKLPSNLSSPLLDHCHVLIERFPIGRDFGSYKLGIDWIKRQSHLGKMETLALVNDSLYYPMTIADTIRELLLLDNDWMGLYENYESEYHVQSFFQVFRQRVLNSKEFKEFWKNYKPLSSRMHFIEKGEKDLSRALVKAGFLPSVLYDSPSIQKKMYVDLVHDSMRGELYKLTKRTLGQFGIDLQPNLTLTREALLAGPDALLPGNGFLSDIFSIDKQWEFYASEAARYVGQLAERHNPTHATGLLCNMLFLAPIKRDICLKGIQHSISELLSFACGFTDSEKTAMQFDLRSKGLPNSAPLYSWRWIKLVAGLE